MAQSSIEWTELTWNPVTGCNKVSEGCRNCYAEIMTRRLQAMGSPKYKDGFRIVKMHSQSLNEPYEWNGSKMVFVNSMSDLFHHAVSEEFITNVFRVMNENPNHIFQVLTKRTSRLVKLNDRLNWTDNIWMGTSVENDDVVHRIDDLRNTGAQTKFLSIEPLIGQISNLELLNVDWVIVGGESGPRARPMKKEWVTEIRDQCVIHGVPFFFKQWGGANKKKAGRILDGRTWDEIPTLLTT